MAHEIPTTLEEVENLPISTYWNEDAKYEFITSDLLMHNYADRLNLIRHLFVNGVPLRFMSLRLGGNCSKFIRRAFVIGTESFLVMERFQKEGYSIPDCKVACVSRLNERHVSVDEQGETTIQDITKGVFEFGAFFQSAAFQVFQGLTEDHQKKFLPADSRSLLLSPA